MQIERRVSDGRRLFARGAGEAFTVNPRRQRFLLSLVFTGVMLTLVSAATAGEFNLRLVSVLVSVAAMGGAFYQMFPSGRFFAVVLTNMVVIYAVAFTFIVAANFQFVSEWAQLVGFPLPLAGFLLGSFVQRQQIRRIVRAANNGEPVEKASKTWLWPVLGVVALTFFEPGERISQAQQDALFLAQIAIITVVVATLSRDVCAFIVHTGAVFSDFFESMARLSVPAFAFLTMYSLNVIVFACIYRIYDLVTAESLFSIGGEQRTIDFMEAIYFSIVTVSTVGYGDLLPLADGVRMLTSLQILLSVVLMLFGFAEIMRHSGQGQDSD